MDRKPYLIMIASQKGGVGKTTVAINLATALSKNDYRVLLVDADTATFSVNEHLGIQAGPNGFVEAVENRAPISDCIFAYQQVGMDIMFGSDSKEISKPDADDMIKFYGQLTKMDYDFIVVDTAPGPFDSGLAKYINDIIIVTTPDSPAATSNARLAAFCAKLKLSYRLVINKSGYSKFELEKEDVEKLFGDVAYGILPEDKIVPESLMKRKVAYLLDNGSQFPVAIAQLSRVYMLRVGGPAADKPDKGSKKGFFRKFADWTIGPNYKN